MLYNIAVQYQRERYIHWSGKKTPITVERIDGNTHLRKVEEANSYYSLCVIKSLHKKGLNIVNRDNS